MSYYFNNGTNYYSDKITNAKKVEDVYHYETIKRPDSTEGSNLYVPSFYIKDGSKPWFDCHWQSVGPITSFDTQHLCIGRMTISSLSSKYTLPGFSNYYYVQAVPSLYKYDVFKNDNGNFKSEFNTVDLNKGGKIYWRIPTSSLGFFSWTQYYNMNGNGIDGHNVLHNQWLNENFQNDRCFVYIDGDKNNTNNFNTSTGRFIKATPNYYPQNSFGFTLNALPVYGDFAPPYFTLDKNDIIGKGYSNLHIKIDAMILAGNNSFGEPYEKYSRIDTNGVNNYASFSANNNQPGTNPYCLALFYNTNNDTTWSIPQSTYGDLHPYINDGSTFSNLKSNGTLKPLVKDKNHYKIKYIKYNNSEIKEVQKLTNMNVWNHSRLLYLSPGLDGLYTDIKTESAPCPNIKRYRLQKDVTYMTTTITYYAGDPITYENKWVDKSEDEDLITNFETENEAIELYNQIPDARYTTFNVVTEDYHTSDCPICTEESYQGSNGLGSVICNIYGLNAMTLRADDFTFNYYLNNDYTHPAGTSSYARWSAGLNCCNGKGFVYKYFRSGDKLYKSTYTAVCPKCAGRGWIECKCVDTDYKDTWVRSQYHDDWGKEILDYKLQLNHPQRGKTHCIRCYENEGTQPNRILPYSTNTVLYRFKFYGKNIEGTKTYEGYIFDSQLNGISASKYYTSAEWVDDEDWATVAPPKIELPNPTAQDGYEIFGVYEFKKTTKEELQDLADYYTDINMSDFLSASNVKTSANWLVYVHENFINYNKQFFEESHIHNTTYRGVYSNTTFYPIWYNKTSSTNTTIKDDFGNDVYLYKWNETGNTPPCATNYTYANVQLSYDIKLSECSGNYLHIAYPYTTIFNNGSIASNSVIIPQISLTYEGTN